MQGEESNYQIKEAMAQAVANAVLEMGTQNPVAAVNSLLWFYISGTLAWSLQQMNDELRACLGKEMKALIDEIFNNLG